MIGYSGWRNYPTWNVALWIDNDPITHADAYRIVAEARAAEPKWPTAAAADALEDYVREEMIDPYVQAIRTAADLLSWAVDQVNWRELAEHYVSEPQDA
jgi:methylmalonyl-CoA mutase N-terminal domain/subunit